MNQRPEYQQTLQRENKFFNSFLGFFHRHSSRPRMLLEVFVRKDFGDKYFNLGSAFTLLLILAVLPMGLYWAFYKNSYGIPVDSFWKVYWSWYLFTALFLFFAIRRWLETRKHSKNLNFSRNYPGTLHPVFWRVKIFGNPSAKIIMCIYEPFFFFLLGFLLYKLGLQIGFLILFSSIFYSIGCYAEFHYGDNFFRDYIDKINREKGLMADLENTGVIDKKGLQNEGPESDNPDETTFAL